MADLAVSVRALPALGILVVSARLLRFRSISAVMSYAFSGKTLIITLAVLADTEVFLDIIEVAGAFRASIVDAICCPAAHLALVFKVLSVLSRFHTLEPGALAAPSVLILRAVNFRLRAVSAEAMIALATCALVVPPAEHARAAI